MDFSKDSCFGARQFPRRQAPSSSADRGHSLSSLHLPPAVLPSLPSYGIFIENLTTAPVIPSEVEGSSHRISASRIVSA